MVAHMARRIAITTHSRHPPNLATASVFRLRDAFLLRLSPPYTTGTPAMGRIHGAIARTQALNLVEVFRWNEPLAENECACNTSFNVRVLTTQLSWHQES